uniref:Uncharacterized protein n=1 Tax=Timema monikensis TaxID=170555 RepID=A0A7R9EH30_9NEOP|nr:unnamed protein product [Timema monikensis]
MVRTMDPCMDMGDGQPMDPEACALKGNTSNTCTCTNMSMGMDMDMDMSMNMLFIVHSGEIRDRIIETPIPRV